MAHSLGLVWAVYFPLYPKEGARVDSKLSFRDQLPLEGTGSSPQFPQRAPGLSWSLVALLQFLLNEVRAGITDFQLRVRQAGLCFAAQFLGGLWICSNTNNHKFNHATVVFARFSRGLTTSPPQSDVQLTSL